MSHERRRHDMIRLLAVAAAVLAVAAAAAGLAVGAAQDGERPIEGQALARASAAALAHTGGGRVTGTEVQDEEGFYEVEVTLTGGREVDVHLDRSFAVVGAEREDGDRDDD
jgi:uncharacterized membrane protein YkoI